MTGRSAIARRVTPRWALILLRAGRDLPPMVYLPAGGCWARWPPPGRQGRRPQEERDGLGPAGVRELAGAVGVGH
jgi:hypothetical protein